MFDFHGRTMSSLEQAAKEGEAQREALGAFLWEAFEERVPAEGGVGAVLSLCLDKKRREVDALRATIDQLVQERDHAIQLRREDLQGHKEDSVLVRTLRSVYIGGYYPI